jgi:hypothetical protein
MLKNTTTNNYRILADQLQNLEIDRNGRVAPRLHDPEPLKNTLLSVLYPGIKVASVNVPAEPLDDYERSTGRERSGPARLERGSLQTRRRERFRKKGKV